MAAVPTDFHLLALFQSPHHGEVADDVVAISHHHGSVSPDDDHRLGLHLAVGWNRSRKPRITLVSQPLGLRRFPQALQFMFVPFIFGSVTRVEQPPPASAPDRNARKALPFYGGRQRSINYGRLPTTQAASVIVYIGSTSRPAQDCLSGFARLRLALPCSVSPTPSTATLPLGALQSSRVARASVWDHQDQHQDHRGIAPSSRAVVPPGDLYTLFTNQAAVQRWMAMPQKVDRTGSGRGSSVGYPTSQFHGTGTRHHQAWLAPSGHAVNDLHLSAAASGRRPSTGLPGRAPRRTTKPRRLARRASTNQRSPVILYSNFTFRNRA